MALKTQMAIVKLPQVKQKINNKHRPNKIINIDKRQPM